MIPTKNPTNFSGGSIKYWNLSPSSLGVWFDSQLMFYYSYLSDEQPTDEVVQAYGISGSLVHSCLEHYAKHKDRNLTNDYFVKEWERLNLDNLPSLKRSGEPLSKMQYHQAMLHGMELLDTKYEMLHTELELKFPYKENTLKKGFVDLICKDRESGNKKIVDWKTSASKDKSPNFRNQVLFYSHLIFCKTGEIITDATIEYLKLKSPSNYKFTREEVINFDINVLDKIWNEIKSKGDNKRNYELGDWNSPFNKFKQKCYQEKLIRENVGAIQCYRQNNKLVFVKGLDENLKAFLDHYFSYLVSGRQFIESYKKRLWDGRRTFLKKKSLPYGFIWKVQELLDVYNKRFKTTFWLDIEDKRFPEIVATTYDTKFKESDIVLRPYQKEAIQQMMQKKVGIMMSPCASGKTITTAEFIKVTNRRTLFLVSKIELVRQTAEEFENYLGVKVGRMVEGNLDIDNQITVASVQTIIAILKRDNEESKKLRMFLFNVTCCISDEIQNVSDANSYGIISDELINTEYTIGLSATPFRSNNETLELNSLCGFIIFKITMKELEEQGWILPTKVYFLSTPQNDGEEKGDYHSDYEKFIINNDLRNKIICDIVAKYKDSKKILVLVKSIQAGEKLEEMIPNSFFLNGSTDKKKRLEMFEKFKNENGLIMVSMTQIFSTGISINDLDIIIQASAVGSDITTIQSAGRCARLNPSTGKKVGVYIDFDDSGIFQPVANKRAKILKEFGFEVNKLHHSEWRSMNVEEM